MRCSRSKCNAPVLVAKVMLNLGPHAIFIWAAYALTFVAIAILTVSILIDDRQQRETLAELERKGIKRRSARAKPASGKKK
jgi:heme exporter protein D